jgi:hypothetical protein
MRNTGLPLSPRERPLTHERDLAGEPVVGTDRAVYHHHNGGTPAWARLGWDEVDQVRWERRAGLLTLASQRPDRAPGLALRLATGSRLAALAGERVTAATLVSVRVHLGTGAGAWVAARRCPDDGEVTWVVTVCGGVDPQDPRLLAAIHHVRVQMGV